MFLHVPTLFVALFLVFALFGLTLSSTLTQPALRDCPELRLWSWGTGSMVLAFAFLASRAFAPEWVAILFGNGLMFVSLLLSSQALRRFIGGGPSPHWYTGAAALGWLGTALVLSQPLATRTLVISMLFALQIGLMVLLVAARGWRAEPSLRMVAITLGLTVAALLVRAGHALANPEQYQTYFQTSLGNGLTYLASCLFPLGAGFCFVLANLERSNQRLHQMATHDSLTGCVNRGTFDSLLQHACDRARRESAALSLLVIDLDEFKQINDAHGHPMGDLVLRRFADTVRTRLRGSDVFGRMGGEEFGVMLPGTDAVGALSVAENLRGCIEEVAIALPGSHAVRLTVSLGIATRTGHEETSGEALYAQADRALYASKAGGRNRATHARFIGFFSSTTPA